MRRLSASLVEGDRRVFFLKLVDGGIGDGRGRGAVGGVDSEELLLSKVAASFFKGINLIGGCKGLEGRIGVGLLVGCALKGGLVGEGGFIRRGTTDHGWGRCAIVFTHAGV